MKFTCTQENLLRGLTQVGHVAGRSTTLPILKNILITAATEGITLAATNLEIGVTTHIRGKVEVAGTLTVQARVLMDYVSLLPSGNISISLEGGDIFVVSEGSKTTLKSLPTEDFPVIPKVTDGVRLTLPTTQLKTALTQTNFAVAADDARPEISGVLFHLHNTELTLAATDSYRLSEVRIPLTVAKEEQHVIVPSRSLSELVRLLPDGGDAQLIISENQVSVQVDDLEFITRLIEGQFPDYAQIIPASFSSNLTIETTTFMKTIRQVSLFCRSGINDVTVQYGSGVVKLSAANAQVGASDVELPANVSGKDGSIVFNWRFLLDGLAVVNSEDVVLQLNDEKGPGLLIPVKPKKDQPPFRYLIMPIRQ